MKSSDIIKIAMKAHRECRPVVVGDKWGKWVGYCVVVSKETVTLRINPNDPATGYKILIKDIVAFSLVPEDD